MSDTGFKVFMPLSLRKAQKISDIKNTSKKQLQQFDNRITELMI